MNTKISETSITTYTNLEPNQCRQQHTEPSSSGIERRIIILYIVNAFKWKKFIKILPILTMFCYTLR